MMQKIVICCSFSSGLLEPSPGLPVSIPLQVQEQLPSSPAAPWPLNKRTCARARAPLEVPHRAPGPAPGQEGGLGFIPPEARLPQSRESGCLVMWGGNNGTWALPALIQGWGLMP